MRNSSSPSLKSANMKWLTSLLIVDALVLATCFMPEWITDTPIHVIFERVSFATIAPILVLLLVNVLPSDVKAMLVYWKPLGVLPGAEAFTKHGLNDSRIDMKDLESNVGPLPSEPKEQNAKWYKFYVQVANEPGVVETHKLFLMYRDMATLSITLIPISLVAIFIIQFETTASWFAVILFLLQYLLTMSSARSCGVRLVRNVLAIHSARKITA